MVHIIKFKTIFVYQPYFGSAEKTIIRAKGKLLETEPLTESTTASREAAQEKMQAAIDQANRVVTEEDAAAAQTELEKYANWESETWANEVEKQVFQTLKTAWKKSREDLIAKMEGRMSWDPVKEERERVLAKFNWDKEMVKEKIFFDPAYLTNDSLLSTVEEVRSAERLLEATISFLSSSSNSKVDSLEEWWEDFDLVKEENLDNWETLNDFREADEASVEGRVYRIIHAHLGEELDRIFTEVKGFRSTWKEKIRKKANQLGQNSWEVGAKVKNWVTQKSGEVKTVLHTGLSTAVKTTGTRLVNHYADHSRVYHRTAVAATGLSLTGIGIYQLYNQGYLSSLPTTLREQPVKLTEWISSFENPVSNPISPETQAWLSDYLSSLPTTLREQPVKLTEWISSFENPVSNLAKAAISLGGGRILYTQRHRVNTGLQQATQAVGDGLARVKTLYSGLSTIAQDWQELYHDFNRSNRFYRDFCRETGVPTVRNEIGKEEIMAYFNRGLTAQQATQAYNHTNPNERISAEEIVNGRETFSGQDHDLTTADGLNAARMAKRTLTQFLNAFRAVGGNARDDTQITDAEVLNYQKHSPDNNHRLTGTQAGQAFNGGWINHTEIQITDANTFQVNLGNGWFDFNFTTHTRAEAVTSVAKNQFITNFKTVAGPSASASDSNILDYFDKNLTPQQAATLYNGNPQVLGSELSKGTNNDEVKYNGQDYKTNNPDSIIAAKQAKIDADNAAKLAQAKTTAINAIQTLLDDTSNNQTKITDTEVKTQLNKTDNNLIDGTTLKDWKDYLNASSTTAEVSSREAKVKQAITAIREAHENPPFDAATARAAAISAVKDYWKTKSNDQTETGTVNGKKITEVLGTDWEREFNDKNDQVAIDSKKTELTGKIESEKSQEKENPAPVSAAEVEETLQEIVGNQEVKPSASVVSSWQEFNKPNSELKTASQIKQFLSENIKDKKVDFVSSLKDLPTAEQPAGKDDQEKITNLLTQKKAETVIKAIFSHKLKKEDSFRKEIETEMENKKDASGKVLDPQFYPKKDGKFTPEAMVNYLLQKKTGQAHKFATIQEQQGGNPKEQSHWDKHKFWYIGGTVLVVAAVGLAAVVWNSLKDLDKKELKTK